jgi:peptidoglycan/LPS O-acetylase OafA/YrhL
MAAKVSNVGAILGVIGATILLVSGLASFSITRQYIPYYLPPFLPYINLTVTVALSAFGLTGAILVFRGFKWGNILILCAGAVGVAGTLLPVYFYDTGYSLYFYNVVSSFTSIDVILLIIGGILGLALAPKKERT